MKPPAVLDSSKVLYWAWSGDKPFGIMGYAGQSDNDVEITGGIEIYGFAICILNDTIYRFSCDREWNVQNDMDFESIQAAMDARFLQYQNQPIIWNKYYGSDIDASMSG